VIGLRLRSGSRGALLLGLPIAFWLLSLVPAMFALSPWLFRAGLAVSLLAILCWSVGRVRLALFSPLLLLAASALLFYSLLPALYISSYEGLFLRVFPAGHGLAFEQAASYVGSNAERMILQFSALAMVAHGVLVLVASDGVAGSPDSTRLPDAPPFTTSLVVTVGIGLTALRALIIVSDSLSNPMMEPLLRRVLQDIADAAAPCFSLCLAFLAMRAPASGGRLLYSLVAACGLGLLIIAYTAKAAIMATLASSSLMLVLARPRMRHVLLFGALSSALFVSVLATHSLVRHNYATSLEAVVNAVLYKLILRQASTGNCLRGVLNAHEHSGDFASAFYFVSAVVPRYLWPEKPSLSRGAEYSTLYCENGDQLPERPHSASITLLGEPIIHAGLAGLGVASLVLLAILSIMTISSLSSPLGALAMLALLPWIVDFDQHFALYIANLAKAGLYIAPFLLLLFVYRRRMPQGI
jgi:hypothetical protein